MTVLSGLSPTATTDAYGINARGVVAGSSDAANTLADGTLPYVGVYWDAAGAAHAIPTLTGNDGQAYGINAAGHVTGYDTLAGDVDTHATVYVPAANGSGGTVADLGGLNATYVETTGHEVNAADQVVGFASTANGAAERAFLYSGGQMYDLTALTAGSEWTLQYAYAINDAGQIVGQGIDPAGYEHAFLLTPTAVPVPAAAGAVGLAVAGVASRRWRRA